MLINSKKALLRAQLCHKWCHVTHKGGRQSCHLLLASVIIINQVCGGASKCDCVCVWKCPLGYYRELRAHLEVSE